MEFGETILINTYSIILTLILLLLSIISWFTKKLYNDMREWRQEVTKTLISVDRRVYRIELKLNVEDGE